jgi:hypothetical protein
MDFPKFVSMLKESALWFSRADLLGDPLEGSFTQAREVDRQRLLAEAPDDPSRRKLEDVFRHNARISADSRQMVCINCWHHGSHESMALWQGYGRGPYAVAVRSTLGALDSLLPEKFSGSNIIEGGAPADPDAGPPEAMPIFLTKVGYIDHSSKTERLKDEYNMFTPFALKSLSYAHENEVRAVYWNLPGFDTSDGRLIQPPGLLVPLDLEPLISDIVVSPLAPAWFAPLVRSVVERYGLSLTVAPSLTSHDPVF